MQITPAILGDQFCNAQYGGFLELVGEGAMRLIILCFPSPGFCVWVEECLLPVCCRQHVWHVFLHHIWTSRNPGLGQRKDPHPPLRLPTRKPERSADH